MAADRLEEQLVRVVVDLVQRVRVRLPPAVCAGEVAGVHVGRHLHAAMALDAVEGALVARAVVDQALLGPVADLDATVLTDELVLLLGQTRRYLRLYARYWVLHALTSDSASHRGAVSGQGRVGTFGLETALSDSSDIQPAPIRRRCLVSQRYASPSSS